MKNFFSLLLVLVFAVLLVLTKNWLFLILIIVGLLFNFLLFLDFKKNWVNAIDSLNKAFVSNRLQNFNLSLHFPSLENLKNSLLDSQKFQSKEKEGLEIQIQNTQEKNRQQKWLVYQLKHLMSRSSLEQTKVSLDKAADELFGGVNSLYLVDAFATLPADLPPLVALAITKSQSQKKQIEFEEYAHLLNAGVERHGVLYQKFPLENPPPDKDLLDLFLICAVQLLSSARSKEELSEKSETDGLTKLYNRRRFDGDIRKELGIHQRHSRPLSLIILDIDNFKNLNDTFGHQTGDEVLRRISKTLKRHIREGDDAYRYGGEEFALILRETEESGAFDLAERLRLAIIGEFNNLTPTGVTASFGLAIAKSKDKPPLLIERADKALYRAKEDGRNRVVLGS